MSTKKTPTPSIPRRLLSLYTGAGGLDIGLERAGFAVAACVEFDSDARQTLKQSRPLWKLSDPGNIHELTPAALLAQAGLKAREATLLSAGPPCQPFSKSANWANGGEEGLLDPRSKTFDALLKVIDAALPRAILIENVKGLTGNGPGKGGLKFLQDRINKINKRRGTRYALNVAHLNAANYGVPQVRERVFLVASIDGRNFLAPAHTHGTGPGLKPYLTTWDAIGDLDQDKWSKELEPKGKWARLLRSIPEGDNYLWHTPRGGGIPLFGWRTKYWSFLLKLSKRHPSWTIQAVPGPATGPFHWRNRQLSVGELARLQTFPDEYRFFGTRRSIQRQIGNAVPCALGELLGLEIRRQLLDESSVPTVLSLIPRKALSVPRAHPVANVDPVYLQLEGKHPDHPGTGMGPGRVWKASS